MKRILSLVLTIAMLFSMGTIMASAEKTDFIRNGSFETLTADGKPESWSVQGKAEHFSMVKEAKDGAQAVRLASETENITITQNVTGLTGGTEYVLTAYMNAKSIVGSAQIKLEFYGADGHISDVKKSYTKTTSGFEPQVVTVTAPAGAVRVNLLLRVLGGGEVIWDNVTFMGEGEAPVSADGKNEFIRNGGFEELNADGSLASWSALSGTKMGTNMEIVDTVQEGKAALHMFSGSDNITVTQRVEGLVGGTEYIFTAFMNAKTVSASGAQIKMEFYAGDTNIAGSDVKKSYTKSTSGFEAQVITFNAPEGATRANILVRVLGGGDVIWDGISLTGQKADSSSAAPEENPAENTTPAQPTQPQTPAEPEEDKEPEVFLEGLTDVLRNGNFENDENTANGGPWGWNPYKSDTWEGNEKTIYVKDFGHNSQRSVLITNAQEGDNPFTYQEISLIPGATYQLSAWIYSEKADENTGEGYASIKVEFYGDKPKAEGGYYSEGRMGHYYGTGGQWKQILYTFTFPSEALTAKIYPRQYGIGTFWIDDVMLCNTEKPSGVNVTTDEVFYYSDHTDPGVATATLNTIAYPEIAGSSVDFRLTKDGAVLAEQLAVPTVNNTASFTYDVALLTEKQAEYKIEVSSGEHKNEWKIYKYDRPTYLSADGVYTKNGKVIQPVFAYRYGEGQYEHGVPNGINVAQLAMPSDKEGDALVAYMKDALDKANAQGVMCLVALYRNMKPAGNEINRATTEMVVSALRDHPAVFGWMVMDETFNQIPNPFEDLRQSYISIRNNDPNHPVYMCEATTRLTEAGRYCDILCVDPYPGNHSAPETFPAERVTLAVNAVKGRKPVYSLLQAIDWQGYWPTGDEMRNMLYQSLMAGGAAVGYYKFRDSVGTTDLHETDLWPTITAFAQNEQTDAFDAFVYDKYPIFSDVKNNDYWAVSFVKDGVLHMVVLNRKDTAQTVNIPLASVSGSLVIGDFTAVCAAGGDGETVSGNGTLMAKLVASGAALYKITPADASVLASVPQTRYHDLSGYGWAYDQILELDAKGIVNAIGAHYFAPGQKITRGDFAMFLIRTLGLTAESSLSTFTDVLPSAHYAKEIAIGQALGILKGVGDGRYMPEAEISRQDLMVICARGMRLVKELAVGDVSSFTDAAAIADYAVADIGAMVNVGIVKGYEDGTVQPLGNTTRAEAAVIMSRILGWK